MKFLTVYVHSSYPCLTLDKQQENVIRKHSYFLIDLKQFAKSRQTVVRTRCEKTSFMIQ